MRRKTRWVLAATLASLAVTISLHGQAGQQPAPQPWELVLKTFDLQPADSPFMATGRVYNIEGVKVVAETEDQYEAAARAFLRANASVLRIDPTLGDLERVWVRDIGPLGTEVRFLQHVRGYPIAGAYVKVFINRWGELFQVNLNYFPRGLGGHAGAGRLEVPVRTGRNRRRRSPGAPCAAWPMGQGEVKFAIVTDHFIPDSARTQIRFELHGSAANGVRPSWRVDLFGGWRSFSVWVDAVTGTVLGKEAHQRQSGTPFGVAEVYDPNPVQNPTVVRRHLLDLLGTGNLYSSYLRIHNTLGDAQSQDQQFYYAGASYPGNVHLREAEVYYHLFQYKRYLTALGFPTVMTAPLPVWAVDFNVGISHYNSLKKEVRYYSNSSYPDTHDSDVVRHEYGHAVHHGLAGWGAYPFSGGNSYTDMGDCMDEGMADYAALSFQDDPFLAEYAASPNSWPYIRTQDSTYTLQDNFHPLNSPHVNGIVFGAAFWHLRYTIGKGYAGALANAFVYLVNPTDTFNKALEGAIIPADRNLYSTKHHETAIRESFAVHGIYGNQTSYPWATGAVLMTTRPYPDTADETVQKTITGAAEVRATFDPYTHAWINNYSKQSDWIYVMDGVGKDIAGSPFKHRELAGQTVRVPGDTIKVRIHSTQAGNNRGPGPRIINLVAADPTNKPPVVKFTVTPGEIEWPATNVTIDASASTDPDGTIIMYEFDPGDRHDLTPEAGKSPLIIGQHAVVRHVYTQMNTETEYEIKVTVTDDKGKRVSVTKKVPVKYSALPFVVDPYDISLQTGGVQAMTLKPGLPFAGKAYTIAGSMVGVAPGFTVAGAVVPLNPDPYFTLTLLYPHPAPFYQFQATLDTTGRAEAKVIVPPGLPPALAGLTLHHAFVVTSSQFDFISNWVPLKLEP